MRADDHQFFQPMYIATFGARTARQPFDEEKTGWGWKTDRARSSARTPASRPPAR